MESGKTVEITGVDGRDSEHFYIVIRPVNNQFVWGNQAIPVCIQQSNHFFIFHFSFFILQTFQTAPVSSYLILSNL